MELQKDSKNHNVVTYFMWYMFNKWDKNEAHKLFGQNLGDHLFGKWVAKGENTHDQTMSWYADLDKELRNKVVERAIEVYNEK